MNEDDLKQGKSKKEKVKKTGSVEVKAEKKIRSKAKIDDVVMVEAKAKKVDDLPVEAEPKVRKTKAKTKEIVEVKAEPQVKKTRAKAKFDNETVADEVVAVKAKKVTTKKVVAKAETKATKPQVKKTTAKISAKETEIKPDSLPLAAKIQTQENFDLTESEVEIEALSPVFKELAEPKLPALREENRAFLQIQSPTRIFFYWSLKQNAQETLRRALGNRADDYFLAIRLTNLNTNRDEIHRVESKGSWWFNNIEADTKYRAEVGFYSPNRPFVRIVFSNTLETPRQKPSENVAYQPYFAVNAEQFAEVLDLAGYSQDAFEVYLAGDEPQFADDATQKAFVQLAGKGQVDFSNINLNELRYVLFALASGVSLYALREQVSGNLFEFLSTLTEQNPDSLTEEKVILSLEEFFGVSPFEENLEEEFGTPTVFGASLINFPKQLRKKTAKYNPQGKVSPISSFSLK